MGLFSFLSKKSTENITETVRDSAKSAFSIIDEAFHTDQEKAEASAKAVETYCKIWEFTTKENTGTSVARRNLMDRLTNFILIACAVCICADIANLEGVSDSVVEHIKAFYIGEALAGGTAFYFLTHVAKGIKN